MHNSNILSNSTHMLSHDFTTCMTSKWMAHVWFAAWSKHSMQEPLEITLPITNWNLCLKVNASFNWGVLIGYQHLQALTILSPTVVNKKVELPLNRYYYVMIRYIIRNCNCSLRLLNLLSFQFVLNYLYLFSIEMHSFFWKHGEQWTWTVAIKPKRPRLCWIY